MTTKTNQITSQGYTGRVFFFKSISTNYFGSCDEKTHVNLQNFCDYVFLGACEVDVTFEVDTREAEISGLEKQRESILAELGRQIATIEGSILAELGRQIATIEERISKLRALPHTEAGVFDEYR